MSGISKQIIYGVNRLRSTFVDNVGNSLTISGTGFWLHTNARRDIFITNKHNIDPRLKLGASTPFQLRKFEIELRQYAGNVPQQNTQFFECANAISNLVKSNDADVCTFSSLTFLNHVPGFLLSSLIKQTDLADQSFFTDKVQIMDFASFIGFPGSNGSTWWDQSWNLAVARFASIASMPEIPFTHNDIQTSDTALVSGLSFSGSSGSPLVLHEKGLKVSEDSGLSNPGYIPPKILGIMSGHWWDSTNTPAMFRAHSGISYFTRSTAILDLISLHAL